MMSVTLDPVMQVAPYVGAWIETHIVRKLFAKPPVAPYVGAWIETQTMPIWLLATLRRTLRGSVD